MIKTTFFLILMVANIIIARSETIIAQQGKFIKDESLKLIVCNTNISKYTDLQGVKSLQITLNGRAFVFKQVPAGLAYGAKYTVIKDVKSYQLYFTSMPLINISTASTIVDEPKVSANFMLTDTSSASAISTFCGIELRGGFSQSKPKKSYDIELWNDKDGTDDVKIPLLNMRSDDDWILLAMYNEPLRIRNVTNHRLWQKIHKPYYANKEKEAKSGIETRYVELAVNNEYMGVYALGEQVDRQLLKLKKYKTSIKGELYKGKNWGSSVTFKNLINFDNSKRKWGGFEIKYPKEKDITEWKSLHSFVDFVVNSDDNTFKNTIAEKFNIDNAVDYFIFLNVLRAADNTGKNIYLAKYNKDEPYFYVPWDLDGVFGIKWNGDRWDKTNDILTNGLYKRLFGVDVSVFKQKVSDRWKALNNHNVLTKDSIKKSLNTNYNLLLSNGNYEREMLKWGAQSVDLTSMNYTYTWLDKRYTYLDNYFRNTIVGVNDIHKNKGISIYPNPVQQLFKIAHSKEIKLKSCCIYSISGQLLLSRNIKDNQEISIKDFKQGTYFLILTDIKNKTSSFKIVKE